jgi:hypothetical protein
MSTFPHQVKLLGATGQCRLANMVSEQKVSSSNPDRCDFIKIYCHRLLFHVCALCELHVIRYVLAFSIIVFL